MLKNVLKQSAGLFFFFSFLLLSCNGKKSVETSAVALGSIDFPDASQAVVLFVSGDVSVESGKGNRAAEIGSILNAGDKISTGSGASCSIQLGNTAVSQIEEDSLVEVTDLIYTEGVSRYNLTVFHGTVLSKVRKLNPADSFAVFADDAMLTVRGTEFSVDLNEDKTLAVAVNEGSVAVGSADLDPAELLTGNIPDSEPVMELVSRIEKNQTVIAAGNEMVLTASERMQAKSHAKDLSMIIGKIIEAGGKAINEDKGKAEEILGKLDIESKKQTAKIKGISGENLKMIAKLEEVKLMQSEKKDLKENYVRIKVIAIPKETTISFGENTYTGNFDGLFEKGKELSFLFSCNGYDDQLFEIIAEDKNQKTYTIHMKKNAGKQNAAKKPDQTQGKENGKNGKN